MTRLSKWVRAVSVGATVALLSAVPVRAAVVTLTPSTSSVAVGGTFSVIVGIGDLIPAGPPSLGAFDLTLQFDPLVFAFQGVSFGDPILGDQLALSGVPALTDSDSSVVGHVSFASVSFDDPLVLESTQEASFTLATLFFVATSPTQDALFAITRGNLGDAFGGPLEFSTGTASVGVAPVPAPAAFWLMLSALGSIGLAHRRGAGGIRSPGA